MKVIYKNKKQNAPTRRVWAKVLVALTLLVFSTANVKGQYCIPTGGSSSTSYWLTNITTTGGITNAIYNNSSYAAYTNSYTTQIFSQVIGGTVNIALNASGTNYFICWVDWNQNNVFTDPGETVFQIASYVSSPYTNSIVVPNGTPCGSYRVRFGQTYISPQVVSCGPAAWGSYVDMQLDVVGCTPCSSIPASNTVMSPSFAICPNSSAFLNLANSYNLSGITYQWVSSTLSQVGPWTSVPNGTSAVLATPNLTTNTYYSVIITCTNTSGSYTTASGQVTVQPVVTSTAPYYESFEGIGIPNKLPNCSWSASNLPTTCQTYNSSNTLGRIPRTGNSFASFYYTPAGASYFYTNGIYLTAGITYSAALWYETEYYGYNNFTDLSILRGNTQTPTGLVTIASTNGPAVSNVYKSLSNTFTVPTSGLYYIAVKATAASGSAQYLTWDDLSITIPCTGNTANQPLLALIANTTSICSGQSVNLSISGADTYTWNTGSNAVSITETPVTNVTYTVSGTNTLTGCESMASQLVMVNKTPDIFLISDKQSVCAGSPANLSALGASSYTWSNGPMSSNITVNPTTPTTYTVLATGANGCVGTANKLINILQLPTVNVTSSLPNDMCLTDVAVLTASGNGGVSFQWISNVSSFVLVGNPVNISPSATSVYTVTATDVNGCQKSTTITQNVSVCAGVAEQSALSNLKVYPNPTSGDFSIQSNTTLNKVIEIIDVTGKVVYTATSNLDLLKVNIKDLSNGIYYMKVQSNNSVEIIKIVKN